MKRYCKILLKLFSCFLFLNQASLANSSGLELTPELLKLKKSIRKKYIIYGSDKFSSDLIILFDEIEKRLKKLQSTRKRYINQSECQKLGPFKSIIPSEGDYFKLFNIELYDHKVGFTLKDCLDPQKAYHSVLKIDSKIPEKCLPDTLYTWVPNYQYWAWKKFSKKMWEKGKFPFPLPSKVFTTRTPMSSHGYGKVPIRIKLLPNTKFLYIEDNIQAYDYCEKHKSDPDIKNTVIVRTKRISLDVNVNKWIAEYVMCSPSAIHSWSSGTKLHYDEMIRDTQRNIRYRFDNTKREIYLQSSRTGLFIQNIDVTSFGSWAFNKKIKKIFNRTILPGKKIYYNPILKNEEKSSYHHFKTKLPIYWNNIKDVRNLSKKIERLKEKGIPLEKFPKKMQEDMLLLFYSAHPELLD